MKKIVTIVLSICLAVGVACGTPQPQADPKLEKQVQKEEYEFETALGKLATYISSIKHPRDLQISSIFPNTWLIDAYEGGGSNMQWYGIGIPIPKDVGRGFGYSQRQEGLPTKDWFRMERIGILTPNTDMYIVSGWNGQLYNWRDIQVSNPDMKSYPQSVKLDCFKSEQVVRQPFMVPPEATYGVYLESHKKLSTASMSNLQNTVQQIQGANPYKERTYKEQLGTPSITQLLEQIPAEATKISSDADILIAFVATLNNKYFSQNASIYDKQNQLTSYLDTIKNVKAHLSGIGEYMQPIKQWDFSNLAKYRTLKNK